MPNAEGEGPRSVLQRIPRMVRLGALLLAALFIVLTPVWGPSILSRLSFFQLQRVEIHGLRHLSEIELLKTIAVDTTMSVWMELQPIHERLAQHPQLKSFELGRRLPGTLVVRVVEKEPIVLVPGRGGLVALDATGEELVVDPSRDRVDVPVLRNRSDTLLIPLLAAIRDSQPDLFARISEAARIGRDEIRIVLVDLTVLAMADLTVTRLLDILPVERDLVARGEKGAELDLRFAGQVIARIK